ncbi:MAG: GtrA family protein, partial [Pyrinomonadaceae bacterium]|nr:GtrA family protein [Sphingobacteriaceae bacterium]
AFFVTFPLGFYLSRYVVFQHSDLRRRTQLSRYLLVVLGCILLNYCLLKVFIESMGWYPTMAKIATTFFVVGFSYLSQTYFSFKQQRL